MVARWTSAVVLALFAAFVWWWFDTATPPPMPAPVGPTEPSGAPAAAGGAAPGDATRTELPGAALPAAAQDAGAPAPAVPQGTLQVFVHSETGAALAGCQVVAADHTATTDEKGRAELRLDAGRIHMDVRAPGTDRADAQGWQSIHAGVTTLLDVELPLRSSTSLCLRFVDAADGRPIAGADVAVRAGQSSATSPAELRSDGDGRCQTRVDVLVDWLEVRAPGHSLRIVPAQRGHEAPANALVVPLDRGADLRVVVVDTAERPVVCKLALDWHPWYVQWPPGGDSRGGPCRSERVSDDRGIATFTALPASVSLHLECQPPAGLFLAPEPPFVLAAGGNERRLVLQLGGEVRGTVVDERGAPVAGAAVGWQRADGEMPRTLRFPERMPGGGEVLADAGGAFRFAYGPGEIFVGVVLRGESQFVGPCVRVQVLSGGSQTVELTAAAPLSISGRAIDAGGEPVVGIVLDAEAGGDSVASADTRTDGRFELKGLIAGDYVLTAASAYEGDLGLPRPVPARAGDRDLEVRLEPVRGTLTGRVVDGQGAAASAWVWATQRDGDEGIGAGCDLDGTFTYRGLAAGTWDVQANDHRGRCAIRTGVTVTAGRTWSLELVLQPGAVLRPRHATASSYRLESTGVSLDGDGLERGVPGECHVPPGTWTVVFLSATGEIGRRTVRVAAGDRVIVELP